MVNTCIEILRETRSTIYCYGMKDKTEACLVSLVLLNRSSFTLTAVLRGQSIPIDRVSFDHCAQDV